MRSAMLLVGAMALVACGDDEGPNDPEIDGGNTDAGLDAARPDAGDADVRPDSNLLPDCSPLATTYKLYLEGGLSPLRDVYTLSGAGTVKLERLPGGAYMDAGTFSCTGSLSAVCPGVALDIFDFKFFDTALTQWGDGSTVYGDDWRPMDGQVTVLERADGKKIVIGNPCNGKAGCTAIPETLARVQELFGELRTEIPLGEQSDGGLAGSCGQ